jgi:hypothetical protein
MDSSALLTLFRRIALASAPLLGGCTHDACHTPTIEQTISLASITDAGVTDGGVDELCRRALLPRTVAIHECAIVDADGGQAVRVVYSDFCVGGRRPAQWQGPVLVAPTDPVAAWLAGTAYMEAASVGAFAVLAEELAAHGAPPALVNAARAAIDDERRHARSMGRLALRRHVRPPAVRPLSRRPPADLEAVATQNAVEGCVRETFAAVVACRQAEVARDPGIRAAMRVIAVEETRHAALSFAIDEWSRARLPPQARERVRNARAEAAGTLLTRVEVSEAAALREAAGLPDAEQAVAMATTLRERLW